MGAYVTQQERRELLASALADVLPAPQEWMSGNTAPPDHWIEIVSPLRPAAQQLVVLLRSDGDIQVEYHVVDKPGSPFEAIFLTGDHGETVIATVARFVGELLEERVVLAYARGLFRGGSRFLTPAELADVPPGRLRWVTSWRGTFDR